MISVVLMQRKALLVAILLLLFLNSIALPMDLGLDESPIESYIVIENASVAVSGDNGVASTATSNLGNFQ